jgi:hypothetical protein
MDLSADALLAFNEIESSQWHCVGKGNVPSSANNLECTGNIHNHKIKSEQSAVRGF